VRIFHREIFQKTNRKLRKNISKEKKKNIKRKKGGEK